MSIRQQRVSNSPALDPMMSHSSDKRQVALPQKPLPGSLGKPAADAPQPGAPPTLPLTLLTSLAVLHAQTLSVRRTSGALMYVLFFCCKCRITQLSFSRTSRTSLTLYLISAKDSAVASLHVPAPRCEICLKLIKFRDNKGKGEFKHSLFYQLLQSDNRSFRWP